jgi:uncharacterized membrane protein
VEGDAELPGMQLGRSNDELGIVEPYWEAQLAVLLIAVLGATLPDPLTVFGRWPVPALEVTLCVALIVSTPYRHHTQAPIRRYAAIALVALVSAANMASLALTLHRLFAGGSELGAHVLLRAGVTIWITNIAVFALWYWELDRGGPEGRTVDPQRRPSFAFPEMTSPDLVPAGWAPRFADYLYLAVTNATAFSPTDTLPLGRTAKLLMGGQGLASFVTVAIVAARAVNILH